jgi:hypothetical protein
MVPVGLRDRLRAIGVAVHVVAVVLSALPSTDGGMRRADWAQPAVQEELGLWADRLGMPHAVFTERAWAFAVRLQRLQRAVLAPVDAYERVTGTAQSWTMFVAPDRVPSRFLLEVAPSAEGPWTVRYRARDDAAAWMRPALDHERLRSSIFRWAWPSRARSLQHGCEALAWRVFDAEPGVARVRCRFDTERSASPEDRAAGRPPRVRPGRSVVVLRGGGGHPLRNASPAGAP